MAKWSLENIVCHFLRQLWLVLGVQLMEINSNRCFPGGVFLLPGTRMSIKQVILSCIMPDNIALLGRCCSNSRTLCHFMGFNCSNKLRYPSSKQKKRPTREPGTVTCERTASSSTRFVFQKINGGNDPPFSIESFFAGVCV